MNDVINWCETPDSWFGGERGYQQWLNYNTYSIQKLRVVGARNKLAEVTAGVKYLMHLTNLYALQESSEVKLDAVLTKVCGEIE